MCAYADASAQRPAMWSVSSSVRMRSKRNGLFHSAGPSSFHVPAALLAQEEAEHGGPSAVVRVKIKK